ncbi:MAG TPA: MFS transporter [Anaerolineaceae bacterium]|nr:MAG: MFS transporter [Chloroflexi bacterium GWB2_54_36]HAL16900.1 MFS transporter [Anaerolineaceae bacterium]
MKQVGRYRWFVLGIFFIFMLLHQADKLLIGPLTTPIMEQFQIDEAKMGLVFSGAILVGAIFYPLWGYLYDRFSRAKLLALASFIWGATTWVSAVARTFPVFLGSRASTGIDDSSYPGIYSLISDYFPPKVRGKVYGILQIAQPLGYMAGMLLALMLVGKIGWQGIFFITGSLGIFLAVAIFFFVKDVPRGKAEPEMENIELTTTYKFSWKTARELFKKKSLLFLFAQGFAGVFPWQVITFWFFRYLETERNFSDSQVMITMVISILFLAAGYPIGGVLGDTFFKKNPRGRLLVSACGILAGAIMLGISLSIPNESTTLFTVSMAITAIFIPFASPNVLSTIYDVTLPEVRSTSNSIQYLIEQGGSAVAPALAGAIAVQYSLHSAILYISVGAWILCFLFILGAAYFLPGDIKTLRNQMSERAALETSNI